MNCLYIICCPISLTAFDILSILFLIIYNMGKKRISIGPKRLLLSSYAQHCLHEKCILRADLLYTVACILQSCQLTLIQLLANDQNDEASA